MTNSEQRVGVEIVEKACQVPCKLIADNAGHEGAVVVGNLLRHNDKSLGFNAQTGEYVNMIQAGKDPLAACMHRLHACIGCMHACSDNASIFCYYQASSTPPKS